MKPLPLVCYPDERLRTKTEPVKRFDREIATLAKEMIATMRAANGVGLAAPQIGSMLQLFVAELPGGPRAFVNPRILKRAKDRNDLEEGCLSIPGIYGIIERPDWVELSFQTTSGKILNESFDGLSARIVQHEIDHLHGVLFIDHWKKLTHGAKEAERLQIRVPQ